jgi:hypothetical protein
VTTNLTPAEPLSQVVFVHDYVQLVFQGERFSIYNPLSVAGTQSTLRLGSPGLCDALVRLIGQSAVCVTPPESCVLALSFERGDTVFVSKRGAAGVAEAFEFRSNDNRVVVEPNAA